MTKLNLMIAGLKDARENDEWILRRSEYEITIFALVGNMLGSTFKNCYEVVLTPI